MLPLEKTKMNKKEIRLQVLGIRDALSQDELKINSRIIMERLIGLSDYTGADNILCYASMRSEVVTDDILLDAIGCGKKVFCPKVTDSSGGLMEFVRIYHIEDLKEGYYGIREPEISEESELYRLGSNERTLVIVPGVAFDCKGNRIGYSGGFYDRFLCDKNELFKAALAFECQVMKEDIPSEIHDVIPDILITEKRIYGKKEERDN